MEVQTDKIMFCLRPKIKEIILSKNQKILLDSLELIRGDLNSDGVIDISDFTIMSKNYNTEKKIAQDTLKPIIRHLNTDGIIDINDFTILSTNYNKKEQQNELVIRVRFVTKSFVL